jgi:hypothetical protein
MQAVVAVSAWRLDLVFLALLGAEGARSRHFGIGAGVSPALLVCAFFGVCFTVFRRKRRRRRRRGGAARIGSGGYQRLLFVRA